MDIKTLYIVVIFSFVLVGVFFFVKSKTKGKANFQMALFLCAMAIAILQTLFKELQIGYNFFGIPASYTIGVSLYFYTQYSIGKEKKDFTNNYYIHYAPALICLIYLVVLEVNTPKNQLEAMSVNRHNFLIDTSIHSYLFVGMMFHFFLYALLSLFKINEHEKIQKEYTTQELGTSLKWLRYLLTTLLIIGLSTVLSFIFKAPRIVLTIHPILCFAVILLIIYNAIIQPQVFEELKFDKLKESLNDDGEGKDFHENLFFIKQKIEKHLRTSKSYLQKDYTVKQLSTETGVPAYKVSKAINKTLNTTFSRLINLYRIEESKEILANNVDATIDGIADKIGFNSRVSFIDAFKKLENITPHAYRTKITGKFTNN
jgi:AraC-like DNA-binding protein